MTPKNPNKSVTITQKDISKNSRPTVKRIGLDLKNQPRNPVRNSSLQAAKRSTQSNSATRQYAETSSKTARKSSVSKKRPSDAAAAGSLYN